jgi:hypothetical protein
MAAAVLTSSMNVLVYSGQPNILIQAIYAVGIVLLLLACTPIHLAQARRSGGLGLLAYLLAALSLMYANVAAFLTLAEMAGIEGVHQALVASGEILPVVRVAVVGCYAGLLLLGLAVARAGVFPRWAGGLVALGIPLQVLAQLLMDSARSLSFVFILGGSILFGAGLFWLGWSLWTGWAQAGAAQELVQEQGWAGPLAISSGLLLGLDAILNTFWALSLMGGVVHLLSLTALALAVVGLHAAQVERAGALGLAGFGLTHLGAALSVIPAYFIMAQLAGAIETNRALMAAWDDIPVGRVANYMTLAGFLLLGIATMRAQVFPQAAGWLMVAGLLLMLPSQFQSQAYLFQVFWPIGGVLGGLGLGWAGWRLRAWGRPIAAAGAPA